MLILNAWLKCDFESLEKLEKNKNICNCLSEAVID